MKSRRRWHTTAPAIAGLAAGAAIIATAGTPQLIGAALFIAGLAALCLTKLKSWVTDTSFEKQRLRITNLNAEEAARQAQVGHALQLGERERDRRLMEEVRQEAAREVRAAQERAEQAEINTSMRAHAFEEACEQRTARAIYDAEQRADERVASKLRELEAERGDLMIQQYLAGVRDERSGAVDEVLAGMADSKVVHLDDRRRQAPEGDVASAPR